MDLKKRIEELIATIQAMNRYWTEGWNEEKFRKYIHPHTVAIVPAASGRHEGQDAYIAVWGHFVKHLLFTNEERPITRCRSIPEGKVPWSCSSSLSRFRPAYRSRPSRAEKCSTL
jgi:hypothetical protein